MQDGGIGGGRRVGVVVVHGVGECEPGDTVGYVSRCLEERFADLKFDEGVRVYQLEQPESPLTRSGDKVPLTTRRLALPDGGEAWFYEVYWADLSRLGKGWFSSARGALKFVFEIPHVIDSMLRDSRIALAMALHRCVLFATVFVRGPLAAFCAVMLAGGLSFLLYAQIPERENVRDLIAMVTRVRIEIPVAWSITLHFLASMCFLAGLALWVLSRNWKKNAGWSDLGFSTLIVVGAIILDLLVFKPDILKIYEPQIWDKMHSSAVHYALTERYYPSLEVLWLIWAGLMAPAFVAYALASALGWRRTGQAGRGLTAALAVAVLQSTVWLAAIPALAILHIDNVLCADVAKGIGDDLGTLSCKTVAAGNRKVNDVFNSVRDESHRLPPELSGRVAELIRERGGSLNESMVKAYRELSASFLYNGSALLGCIFLVILVALWRYVRSRATWVGPDRLAERLPRLIVSRVVLVPLLLVGAVNCFLIFYFYYKTAFVPGFSADRQDLPPHVFGMGAVGATVAVLAVRALWGALRTPLEGVLHIMHDLIDHQYRRRIGLTTYLGRAGHASRFVRRERIADRFRTVFDRLLANHGCDHIVFLAHSQGTVLVYEYLREMLGKEGWTCGKPAVLTVGSPLGHLYKYYFAEYRGLDAELCRLDPHLSCWINAYRFDDPIAGSIGSAESCVRNIAMGRGGHLRYWADEKICTIVRQLISTDGTRESLTLATATA